MALDNIAGRGRGGGRTVNPAYGLSASQPILAGYTKTKAGPVSVIGWGNEFSKRPEISREIGRTRAV